MLSHKAKSREEIVLFTSYTALLLITGREFCKQFAKNNSFYIKTGVEGEIRKGYL